MTRSSSNSAASCAAVVATRGLQIVANDFGGDVLDDGLLRQAGNVFQVEPVLEPLERLLDAPALVVQLGKATGGIALLVEEVRHQHALFALGRDGAYQAHALGFARAFIVERVALARRRQRDDALEVFKQLGENGHGNQLEPKNSRWSPRF